MSVALGERVRTSRASLHGTSSTVSAVDDSSLVEARSATVLGAFFDGSTFRVGKVRGGHLLSRHFVAISTQESAAVILDEMLDLIDRTMDREVEGIGFGVPSIVDVDEGIVFDTPNVPSWKRVNVRRAVEDRFGVPCRVNNEANAFAVGERFFGAGQDFDNVIGVVLGAGFGCGVILGGRLCNGANCGVGEIGHIPYLDGEFEDYCSRKFFNREAPQSNDLFLMGRAKRGDAETLELFERFGQHLGKALLIVLYSYDPEVIILGGPLADAFPYFERSLRQELDVYRFRRSLEKLKIVASPRTTGGIRGSAAIFLDTRTS